MANSDFLRGYLEAHDARCPGCNYNLRGLTSSRCPECNENLVLVVGLAEPRIASFVAALIGLAAGAGFSAAIVAYALFAHYGGRGMSNDVFARMLLITGSGLVVEGSLLALLLWKRRRFRRLSPGVRGMCILTAWLLSLAVLVVFTASMR